MHAVMTLHQNLGYVIVGLSLFLSLGVIASKANIPSKLKGFFLAGLLVLGLAIAQTADLGGRMVFLNGVGVGQKSMMPTTESGHEQGSHDHASQEHGGLEPVEESKARFAMPFLFSPAPSTVSYHRQTIGGG